MLVFLTGDTVDTVYRFVVIGYFGDGATFPGLDHTIKPDSVDLFVFLLVQVGIIKGIYLLYRLKRSGGYYFMISNIFFLVYGSLFGPLSEVGILNIFTPVFLYFFLYVFFALLVPFYYSENFN